MSVRKPVVALMNLGRPQAMGERHRVEGFGTVFAAAGADVVHVELLRDFRSGIADALRVSLRPLLEGRAVPESMAWSRRDVLSHLESLHPDVVLCSTARAYHPDVAAGSWTTVLDLVDRLSVSYRDRAAIGGLKPTSVLYRSLAATMSRFERHPLPPNVKTIAAGWREAVEVHATWVPTIMTIPPPIDSSGATHDLVFFGNLSYAPNAEAVDVLARIWPRLTARRPATSLLLAGARPGPRIVEAAERCGWTLVPDFGSVRDVLVRARLGVVPLVHASGIQTKVLEAASFGVPQVVSPATHAGLDPDFPVALVRDDAELVDRLAELLDDPKELRALGAAARAHIEKSYTADRWIGWATSLVRGQPSDEIR